MSLLLIIPFSILFLCSIFLSFWLVDEDLIPHAPQNPRCAENINGATGTFSIFVLVELIATASIALVLKYVGFEHLFESSWLLKVGFLALGGGILFYIDNKIRNKRYSFTILICLSIVVVIIVGMLLSLCSKSLMYMLLIAIAFLIAMFTFSIRGVIDEKEDVFDFSPMAIAMSFFFILGFIYYFIKSLIDGEPLSKDAIWIGCIAIVIAVWWLWVSIRFIADMQKKADRYFPMGNRICFMYGTELILAYVILIVKNFIPNLKDVFENIEDIDIDI